MTQSWTTYRTSAALALPLILFLGVFFLLQSSLFDSTSTLLVFGITADLVLLIPVVYFLAIRKTAIPNITVVPVMVVGLLLGSYMLPVESQTFLDMFKVYALPIIELSVIAYLIITIRKTIQGYKKQAQHDADFFTALKTSAQEVLPKVAVWPVVTEVSVFYYGFAKWGAKTLDVNEFSYHRKSGAVTLYVFLICLVFIETAVLHLLLSQWSIIAAWILTGISLYTAIQIFGILKSLYQRPIRIGDKSLIVRYGVLAEVHIPFDQITRVEVSTKPIENEGLTQRISPLGELENHNVIVKLATMHEIIGFYGIRKPVNQLVLHLDAPEEFVKVLSQQIPA